MTGGSALPATTSAYSPENGTFSRPVGSYPGINLVGYSQSIGDVNGDGNADIIYTASTSSELYVYTLLSKTERHVFPAGRLVPRDQSRRLFAIYRGRQRRRERRYHLYGIDQFGALRLYAPEQRRRHVFPADR